MMIHILYIICSLNMRLWFDFNRETSDAIQIKDKFYLSAVELPSFIRMHQENRKP